MFDLVYWSFVMSLTPLALGFILMLVDGARRLVESNQPKRLQAPATNREATRLHDLGRRSNCIHVFTSTVPWI